MVKRIGFACKWSEKTEKGIQTVPGFNTQITTLSWLNRQTRPTAEQRLWDIMQHNLTAIHKLVCLVGGLTESLRMVRLSSDILPMYTAPSWRMFWKRPDVQKYCSQKFSIIGNSAKLLNVRLSMHPGQFCCLSSENSEVVERSILEFEYHCDMIRWMGYGTHWQDFKCNVHIGGRKGPDGFRAVLKKLSPEARNSITIENDEFSWGLDDILKLSDCLPIVLDLHHHFIKTGEYISPSDNRISIIKDSWREVRPVIHYSQSKINFISPCLNKLPNLQKLLDSGVKKQHLRAHSDYYSNDAVNTWAKLHWNWADIMCELKSKNLGSNKLYEQWG